MGLTSEKKKTYWVNTEFLFYNSVLNDNNYKLRSFDKVMRRRTSRASKPERCPEWAIGGLL